ncbi:Uncharacterized protein APZ42_001754 [Daphnia magna]|uniref:Uncharacterized protein n=1 Tax=Daphnia magna TaxID=35525 RepID=A0A162C6U7_9CRUS|nr:Uncharacterized protein APZ42_001754 [Daphnia magna]
MLLYTYPLPSTANCSTIGGCRTTKLCKDQNSSREVQANVSTKINKDDLAHTHNNSDAQRGAIRVPKEKIL